MKRFHIPVLFCLVLIIKLIPVMAVAQSLDGLLVVTIDNAAHDKWDHSPPNAMPSLASIDTLFRQQESNIIVVVGNYSVSRSRVAKVVYDLEIYSPDGELYFRQESIPAVSTIVDRPNQLRLADVGLKLNIEKDEPLGRYRITVVLRDLHSGVEKRMEKSLEVVEYEFHQPFENDKQFGEWFRSYHYQLSSENIIGGYLYFARSVFFNTESSFKLTMAFFVELFNANRFLLGHVKPIYESADSTTRSGILALFRYLEINPREYLGQLSDAELAVYQKWLRDGMPDTGIDLKLKLQISVLWGRFLGTGSYAPVRRIVSALMFGTEEDPVHGFAKATLDANCRQNLLVRGYCRYIFDNERLTKHAREALNEILTP